MVGPVIANMYNGPEARRGVLWWVLVGHKKQLFVCWTRTRDVTGFTNLIN